MFPYSTQQTTPQLNPVRSPPPPGTVFASFTGTPFSFFRFLGAFAFSFTYKQLRSRSPVRSHPPGRTVFAFMTVRFSAWFASFHPARRGVAVVPWDPTANDVHVRTELAGYDGAVRRLRIHRTARWQRIGTDQHATDRLCLAAQPEPRLCRRRPRRPTDGLRGTSEGVGGQWCAPPAAARGRSLRGGSGAPAARTGRPAMPQPSAAAASLCASA